MIICLLLIVACIAIPLCLSLLLLRKRKWYYKLISFSLTSLLCTYIIIALNINDPLGVFYYNREVYDLETLAILYYFYGIYPLAIILIIGSIAWLGDVVKTVMNSDKK
jgi:hypothetical protein